MEAQKNCLDETVLLRTQNKCLNRWIGKYFTLNFFLFFGPVILQRPHFTDQFKGLKFLLGPILEDWIFWANITSRSKFGKITP